MDNKQQADRTTCCKILVSIINTIAIHPLSKHPHCLSLIVYCQLRAIHVPAAVPNVPVNATRQITEVLSGRKIP
jgi:hypothetical protein